MARNPAPGLALTSTLTSRALGPWPRAGPLADVSFILGSMVPEGAAESAGRVLFALYSTDTNDDSAASQTLVPFILGTLLDHNRAGWAVELAKQLMYTTLEVGGGGSEGERGKGLGEQGKGTEVKRMWLWLTCRNTSNENERMTA
jgi:hypothetical protein